MRVLFWSNWHIDLQTLGWHLQALKSQKLLTKMSLVRNTVVYVNLKMPRYRKSTFPSKNYLSLDTLRTLQFLFGFLQTIHPFLWDAWVWKCDMWKRFMIYTRKIINFSQETNYLLRKFIHRKESSSIVLMCLFSLEYPWGMSVVSPTLFRVNDLSCWLFSAIINGINGIFWGIIGWKIYCARDLLDSQTPRVQENL